MASRGWVALVLGLFACASPPADLASDLVEEQRIAEERIYQSIEDAALDAEECMRREGFEYEVALGSDGPDLANEDSLDILAEWVFPTAPAGNGAGYGIVAAARQSAEPVVESDFNDRYRSSLPQTAKGPYDEFVQSCQTGISAALASDLSENELRRALVSEIDDRARADPLVNLIEQRWAACMSEAGWNFGSLGEPPLSVLGAIQVLSDQVGGPMLAAPQGKVGLAAPIELANRLPRYNSLNELAIIEDDLSEVDRSCRDRLNLDAERLAAIERNGS